MNQSCTIISNRIQSKDYLIERIVKWPYHILEVLEAKFSHDLPDLLSQ